MHTILNKGADRAVLKERTEILAPQLKSAFPDIRKLKVFTITRIRDAAPKKSGVRLCIYLDGKLPAQTVKSITAMAKVCFSGQKSGPLEVCVMNDHSRYARAESIAYNLSYKKHRSPDNENSIRVHFPAPQPAPVLVSV